MWNRDYQVRRIRYLKRESVDFCTYYIMQVMRHLIVVFVIAIIASFGMMIYLVEKADEDQMGIENANFGLQHTAFSRPSFDLLALADMVRGTNDTERLDLIKYGVHKYVKGRLVKHGDWRIHPVYKFLQE